MTTRPDAKEAARIKAEYAVKRTRQLVLAAPVVGVLVVVYLSADKESLWGVPTGIVAPAAFVLVLGAVAFSFWNWRCPACRKYLGRSTGANHCPHCGVELR